MATTNKIILEQNQVWRSETNPERDFKISYIADSEIVCWFVANDDAWSKWVCDKKKVESIDELLKNGRDTFPYPYTGERNIKSTKAYIRKYDMALE